MTDFATLPHVVKHVVYKIHGSDEIRNRYTILQHHQPEDLEARVVVPRRLVMELGMALIWNGRPFAVSCLYVACIKDHRSFKRIKSISYSNVEYVLYISVYVIRLKGLSCSVFCNEKLIMIWKVSAESGDCESSSLYTSPTSLMDASFCSISCSMFIHTFIHTFILLPCKVNKSARISSFFFRVSTPKKTTPAAGCLGTIEAETYRCVSAALLMFSSSVEQCSTIGFPYWTILGIIWYNPLQSPTIGLS